MTEPLRLRDSAGPASALLRGAKLAVPSAARRRALAFTGVAANMAVGGTALAASGMSLVKSVALCVSLGVVGGGVASLGVSSALSSWDAPPSATTSMSASPKPRSATPMAMATAAAPSVVPAEPEVVEPEVVEPVPVTEPTPVKATASAPASFAPSTRRSLFDEQQQIESARAAITRGDVTRGLQTLDSYARSFPRGQFHPEALALRVEALSSRGDSARAQKLADEFASRYPQHPLLSRVQASIGRR